MKANRKFVQADDAVSPVIAVILMVAITVVLAATVFVLVSDIGGQQSGSAPSINFTPDEGANRLTVNSATNNADWNRLAMRVTGCTATPAASTATPVLGGAAQPYQNTNGIVGGGALGLAADGAGNCVPLAAGGTLDITNTAARVNVGDFLDFCVDSDAGGTDTMSSVAVEIRDVNANQLTYSYTFVDWAPC